MRNDDRFVQNIARRVKNDPNFVPSDDRSVPDEPKSVPIDDRFDRKTGRFDEIDRNDPPPEQEELKS